MARQIPGRFQGIGKRWPYKALNFLPPTQLWKYLGWKSGPALPAAPFQLGKSLTGCKRILVALPDGFQENLVAFSVVQSLVQERPDTEFLFLIEHHLTGFLAALLGSDRVAGIRWDELYWGEAHFQELQRIASAFHPEIALNFRAETPPLLHFVLRASGAPIRVQVAGDPPVAFANVALRPADPPNHLRRFAQATRLWDVSERPVPVKWTRLAAGPENLKEAHARICSKGLRPEATRLFLWQEETSSAQRELFRKVAAERAVQGEAQSLLVVNGAGPFFPTPPPPQDVILGIPSLEIDSTGLLLGLFARTRRSIGTNGPLLHLASLADTDVEAHFSAADAVWDVSATNARMKVIYEEAAGSGRSEGSPGTVNKDIAGRRASGVGREEK